MTDDIVTRLQCIYAAPPCEQCTFCAARAEIERLRAENDDLQVLLRGRTVELQAEIERLRAREQDLRMHAEQDACEIERLRAAGDALAAALNYWNEHYESAGNDMELLQQWQQARRG